MRQALAVLAGIVLVVATVAAIAELSPAGVGHWTVNHPGLAVPPLGANPRSVAQRNVDHAFRDAPLPPGARVGTKALDKYAGEFTTSTSLDELRRTGWWTAPGTIEAAVGYVSRHIPAGMRPGDSGSGSTTRTISYSTAHTRAAPYGIELDYAFGTYGSRIAIRLDAWTVFVPTRPSWSYVPASATSVDVTVVRKALSRHYGGAPTVHRTLTGATLRQFATALNALPSAPAEGVHTCPAPLVDAAETAVFHSPHGTLRMSHLGGGCEFTAKITTAAQHHPAEVSAQPFAAAVLTALGLPRTYGFQR